MRSEADRIIDLYQRHASRWASGRGKNLFEKSWLDSFLAHLPPRGDILDLGCGAGDPIARYFVVQGYRVTGLDSSSRMIAMCKESMPDQTWIVGDMRQLALPRRFDGILAWDSFFHLCPDDQRRMFPLFKRHARPRAALMFTSGPSFSEIIGSYQGEPLYHASLDEAEYRSLLQDNGFAVLAYVAEDPTCGRHTVWLAQQVG